MEKLTHLGVVLFFFLAAGGTMGATAASAASSTASSPESPGPDMDLFIASLIDDMFDVR